MTGTTPVLLPIFIYHRGREKEKLRINPTKKYFKTPLTLPIPTSLICLIYLIYVKVVRRTGAQTETCI